MRTSLPTQMRIVEWSRLTGDYSTYSEQLCCGWMQQQPWLRSINNVVANSADITQSHTCYALRFDAHRGRLLWIFLLKCPAKCSVYIFLVCSALVFVFSSAQHTFWLCSNMVFFLLGFCIPLAETRLHYSYMNILSIVICNGAIAIVEIHDRTAPPIGWINLFQ